MAAFLYTWVTGEVYTGSIACGKFFIRSIFKDIFISRYRYWLIKQFVPIKKRKFKYVTKSDKTRLMMIFDFSLSPSIATCLLFSCPLPPIALVQPLVSAFSSVCWSPYALDCPINNSKILVQLHLCVHTCRGSYSCMCF